LKEGIEGRKKKMKGREGWEVLKGRKELKGRN
jgi:hypothetical protein